ncbi:MULTISPECIES: hypothetical protein [unclassified Paraburkholderia]|uniref:hypothetical protein n=1 Tax=unclassified Paraburkholderia TaxID=2615204 RepID=UPI0020B7F0D2|nr:MULTISPECIES: hypothetical protein [unclassified Paraburkholderia]MCP3717489.1 hypothetical protein [Paraburkholderia sp. CNPSo 3281]MCX5537979.1 hypothetical protein [Paraburkholderia sp. CNPSo 3076]
MTATASQHRQIVEGALDIGFGWSAANAQEDGLCSLVVAREPLVAAVPSGSVHARKKALDQTVSWIEPFTSTCVERFVELAQSVAQRETRGT